MYDHNRKLWMFCYHKVGAQASANLFSLVMTARANEVEPFEYLSYLFEHLPSASTAEAIEALLPWNLKVVLNAQEGSMKGYFKKEAKFLLLWLLGFPLFVIAVGLIATFFITH